MIGHSFVYRFQAFAYKQGRHNLDLDQQHIRMFFSGQPGMRIEHLPSPRTMKEVTKTAPHLVVIDIGTNDIANIRSEVVAEGQAEVKQLIHKLFLFARKLVLEHRVKVVMLQVLPRGSGWHAPDNPKFQIYVTYFNSLVRALCAKQHKKQRHLHFWVHPRMHANIRSLLNRDGVHLNNRGLKRYFHSIKKAVAHYAARR
jgi:lysophospholipase L1-like esterase